MVISEIDIVEDSPLTFEQEREWFLQQVDQRLTDYDRIGMIRFRGKLDVSILEMSINEVIHRHGVLRTSFRVDTGLPRQLVQPFSYRALPVVDLSRLSDKERQGELQKVINKSNRHLFNLTPNFLFLPTLIRLSTQEYLLLINTHHIVFDEWSMRNFLSEMSELYKSFVTGGILQLPELTLTYMEYAVKQREKFSGETLSNHLAYWVQQLSFDTPDILLSFTQARTAQTDLEVSMHTLYVSDNLYKEIDSFCKSQGITLFMLMLSVLNVLLYRYTRENDIRIGCPTSGRTYPGTEPLIGCFENTLVMRTQLANTMTVTDVLHQVRKVTLDAYRHQDVPFARVVEEINSKRGVNTNPLFQVMLSMDNRPKEDLSIPGLEIGEVDIDDKPTFVDLNLKVTNVPGQLTCVLNYNSAIFDTELMIRMANHFTLLLEGFVCNLETPISVLPMLTLEEEYELLIEWNSSGVRSDPTCVHQLFEEQVNLCPHRAGLIFEGAEITYQELDRQANQLANYLNQCGLEQEQLVAVCLERSPELIQSFLGVLKAGGCYVPIDPKYPPERIALMLNDADISILITTATVVKQLPPTSAKVLLLDEKADEFATQSTNRVPNRSNPEDLAYVMYTSGSTGRPKGVCVPHRGISRLVKNTTYANAGPQEVFLSLSTASFDVSVFEIYGALLNGGKLVVINTETSSIGQIGETIRRYGVTTLNVTPVMLNLLLDECSSDLFGLKQILTAGDVLPVWLARKCHAKLRNCQLINAYGPTENSVYSTFYRVQDIPEDATSIPIGRPISNDCVYILDEHLQPVPVGVIGELYVSGDGVARGYLNNPGLTQERFIPDPFSTVPGRKLYKTGDLVRYRPDKNIEFMGRADQQVKIHGCRVEIGEIETHLSTYPGMRQTVVTTYKRDGKSTELVAYVLLEKAVNFNPGKLRSFLKERLPDYMVPTFFVELWDIPLTPVGKIDRKNLPVPTSSFKQEDILPARSLVEQQLAAIWKTLLDVDVIGVNQNFFDLGGNSLLAMQMFSTIEKTFHKYLPVSSIYEADTIEKLAERLTISLAEGSGSLVTMQPFGSKAPLFCIHNINGEVVAYRHFVKQFGEERPIYGLRYSESEDVSQVTIAKLASGYITEIRKVQPSGPFHLIGHSLGGVIAYEMARQLTEQKECVQLLAMLDTKHPACYFNRFSPWEKVYKNIKIAIKLSPKQRFSFLLLKFRNMYEAVRRKFNVNQPVEDTLQRVLRDAMDSYNPVPYQGKMLLFRASERDIHDIIIDEKLGWEGLATAGVEVHHVPGDHGGILEEPYVMCIVKCVMGHLGILGI